MIDITDTGTVLVLNVKGGVTWGLYLTAIFTGYITTSVIDQHLRS